MKRYFLIAVLVLFLVPGCQAVRPASLAPLTGKVTFDRQPVAEIQVAAWPEGSMHLAGEAPYLSALTGPDGQFRLDVPAGSYYLLARGDGLFAYYGRNPVTVTAAGGDHLNIGLVRPEPVQVIGRAGVSGVVTLQGEPQAGAVVFVYTDLTSQLKGMGYLMSSPTGTDGRFDLDLEDGTYYLLARKRQGGQGVGPLRSGDLTGYAPDNPLRVHGGQSVVIGIPLLEVPEKVDRMQGTLFGQTSISGRIVDSRGEPVRGARAVLYSEPQMLNRPLHVSAPTGIDGRYILSIPKGGEYYLAARNSLGGAPAPGELYGTYDGNPQHKLDVEDGAHLKDLDIVVEKL